MPDALPAGHLALVIVPDDASRAQISQALAALGHRAHFAPSVDEALAALAAHDFCYALLDPTLPIRPGSAPLEGAGERVMSSLRTLDDRRDASGFRRTPLLVVADSTDHEHVSRMYDCGGDAYMAKPLAGRLTILRDKITTCLLRAGRVDHARCAEHALLAVRARTGGPVRVSIDGSTSGRRTAVVINDVRRTIQDAKFAVFIRLTAFHVRTPGVWSSRDALGVQGSREALSRIRVQFRGLIPKGFQVIEGDGSRRFRLNTAIVVEHVAWERLADHANAIVRKTAREMLERAAKK